MPHISMTLYAGRTQEELHKMAETLQMSLVKELGMRAGDISVSLKEAVSAEKFSTVVSKRLQEERLLIPSDYVKEPLNKSGLPNR